ncbi:phage tail protein [Clostridium botulinum]|nr:phage tail protein [Clostridium botulinum]
MAEKFYTLLTEIGKAKIANSAGFGSKINFVKMKVGDGGGSYYNPREDQEDLINTVWEGNITHVAIDEKNPNWINVEMMIPANVGGFMIREYGVFDEDNNMLAIAKCAESYKPLAEDGSTKELIMKMVLTVSNTENITLKIDPTIIFAKKSEIEILENKIKNIKIPVTSVNSKTGAIELKAEDIKTNSGESVELQLAGITTYQTAGGTATSINLNLPTLVNGYATTFIVSSNNNKNATTINGKKLYKPNTTTTPNLTAGKAVSVWYNATKDCFFIKASAEGNAIAENVLAGKTFSNDDDTGIAGTMPNRGTFNLGFGATVPAGYYSGGIVPNGKRWACGELSVTINTDRIMSVTGLSFTPSKVIVSCYKYSGSPYTDSLNLIISNIADIYNMYGSFTDHSGDEITSHGEKIKSRIITRGFNVYLPKIGYGGNLKYWAYE